MTRHRNYQLAFLTMLVVVALTIPGCALSSSTSNNPQAQAVQANQANDQPTPVPTLSPNFFPEETQQVRSPTRHSLLQLPKY